MQIPSAIKLNTVNQTMRDYNKIKRGKKYQNQAEDRDRSDEKQLQLVEFWDENLNDVEFVGSVSQKGPLKVTSSLTGL